MFLALWISSLGVYVCVDCWVNFTRWIRWNYHHTSSNSEACWRMLITKLERGSEWKYKWNTLHSQLRLFKIWNCLELDPCVVVCWQIYSRSSSGLSGGTVSLIYTTLNHHLITDKYHNIMRDRYTSDYEKHSLWVCVFCYFYSEYLSDGVIWLDAPHLLSNLGLRCAYLKFYL